MNTLLDAGLRPGERAEAFDAGDPGRPGHRHRSECGSEVDPGSAIAYVVSLGAEPTPEPTPDLVTVPNLRGSRSRGCRQRAHRGRAPAGRARGPVQRQRARRARSSGPIPEAGTEVEPGTDSRLPRLSWSGADPRTHPGTHAGTAVRAGHRARPSRLRLPTMLSMRSSSWGWSRARRVDRVNDAVPVGQVIRTVRRPAPRSSPARPSTTTCHANPTRPRSPRRHPPRNRPPSPTENGGTGPGPRPPSTRWLPRCRRSGSSSRGRTCRIGRSPRSSSGGRSRPSFDEENPASRVAAEETLLKRLGLLPAGCRPAGDDARPVREPGRGVLRSQDRRHDGHPARRRLRPRGPAVRGARVRPRASGPVLGPGEGHRRQRLPGRPGARAPGAHRG